MTPLTPRAGTSRPRTNRAIPRVSLLLGVMLLTACATTRSTPGGASVEVAAGPPDLAVTAGTTRLRGPVWAEAVNPVGPVELDGSGGGAGRGDGRPLALGRFRPAWGYGVHAGSSVTFRTGARCRTFTATIGVDDETGARGRVHFEVVADGETVFDSGPVPGDAGPRSITVDVTGRNTVRLDVHAGDGRGPDRADWAEPALHGCDPRTAASGPTLTPETYGAAGDGVTDDTAALEALFRAMNSLGQPVAFGAGRTYRFRRTAATQFTVTRTGSVIDGRGAVLRAVDSEPVEARWTAVRIMGTGITVQDLTVDLGRGTRPGRAADAAQTAWAVDGGSRDVTLRRVRAVNAPLDGLYIRDAISTLPAASAVNVPTGITLEDVEALDSGRNNLSLVSGHRVTVTGGRYARAGAGAGGVRGGPWAGIDIEPNRGRDVYGNRDVTLDGVETSDNRGSGVDVAQLDNENITIRDHTSHRNGGAALFVSPSGTVTVSGLRARSYGALGKAGVVAIVPSARPGATVTVSDVEVSDVTDRKPAFFQNYTGRVTLDGLRVRNVASTTVLGTYEPTTVSNVYVDGVKIR